MSEYQYYEFRTLDRSLTEAQIVELEKLSSSAEITPTSYTNTYNYGDFRGKPERMMEKYFDAFVHVANWGTRHLMLKLPASGVDRTAIKAYAGGGLSFWSKGGFLILSFRYHGEGEGGWEDGEGWLTGLIALRKELQGGDLRPLYLGWLAGLYSDIEDDDDNPEPPVPPGLKSLTAAQDNLAAFLRIYTDLLELAAERSVKRAAAKKPSQAQFAQWLKSQPAAQRQAWLLKLLGNSAPSTRSEIQLEFRQSLPAQPSASKALTMPPRTCKEFRDTLEARRVAERLREEQTAAKKPRPSKTRR